MKQLFFSLIGGGRVGPGGGGMRTGGLGGGGEGLGGIVYLIGIGCMASVLHFKSCNGSHEVESSITDEVVITPNIYYEEDIQPFPDSDPHNDNDGTFDPQSEASSQNKTADIIPEPHGEIVVIPDYTSKTEKEIQKIFFKKVHENSVDYIMVNDLKDKFLSKFENLNNFIFPDRLFILPLKAERYNYIFLIQIKNNQIQGESILFEIDDMVRGKISSYIAKLKKNEMVYVFGDNLLNLSDEISQKCYEKNIPLIMRNTSISLTFNETEKKLKRFRGKKLAPSNIAVINGVPTNAFEAGFQNFNKATVKTFQNFKKEIAGALGEKGKIILTTEQLVGELTNGSGDVLFLVAHCDGNSMYFGNSKIALEEIEQLAYRTKRDKERIAILVSCHSGNIFEQRDPSLYKKNTQSFAELFLEKNFFDLVIAPSNFVNLDEALQISKDITKHPILNLSAFLNQKVKKSNYYLIVQNE